MIAWYVILGILFIHWIADFCFQTDWQAKNKSINNKALINHVLTYAGVWVIPAMLMFGIVGGIWFVVVTFWCHLITDYFTSRLNTKLYKANKIHSFFVSIGFDQILHYVQLGVTYLLLR